MMALSDLAGELVAVTLVAPQPEFTYKPMIVEEPFSLTPAERRELAPIAGEHGARFLQQGVAAMHPNEHRADLADGSAVEYDAAIVCVGAPSRPAFSSAATLRAGGEPLEINDLLRRAAEDDSRRLALVVPSGVTWTLPLYETALMAERRARELGLKVQLTLVTPEATPLAIFGRMASDAVASLLRARGIDFRGSTHAGEGEAGQVDLTPGGEPLAAGAVIALPLLEGPAVDGLPSDPDGFIPIDEHARVVGAADVYAAGDGTNFPIKQGGIGTQQADTAAEHVAARAGADLKPSPFHPILRGRLLTADESLSLRADVGGGGGEGEASLDYLWWPPHKVSGRYLAAWMAGETPHAEPEPPAHPLDVEVELPHEWHREPMALDPYASPD
jgi:sulfide:quinone oxidoreductase